jgi:hypothetical protein
VKSVCATILQAFISTFGLASTLDELLTDLQTATNATKALASGLVCGATVCTSDTQKGCSRKPNALTGKTVLASAIDSNQGSEASLRPVTYDALIILPREGWCLACAG